MVDSIEIIALDKVTCADVIAIAWGYEQGEHHIQITDEQFKEICDEVIESINDNDRIHEFLDDIVVEVGSEIIPDLCHADDVRDQGCIHSFDAEMMGVA